MTNLKWSGRRSKLMIALITAGAAGTLLATFASASSSPQAPSVEELVAGDTLSGRELADELQLVLEPTLPKGCYYFSEVREDYGYCLDGVVSSKLHQIVIAEILRDRDVTPEELATIEAAIAAGSE